MPSYYGTILPSSPCTVMCQTAELSAVIYAVTDHMNVSQIVSGLTCFCFHTVIFFLLQVHVDSVGWLMDGF